MNLLPHHARELIEGSAIDPGVVARRGYRSVTAAETAALGFADYQQRDGLLIPRWSLAGVQRGFLLKPDRPRTDDTGRVVKYEFIAGAPPMWDIHPDALPLLRDRDVPIYFTEGVKKEDSAVSAGVLCVDIGSVWMFLNNRLVVPDLDEIPVNGRPCWIGFDSDASRKAAVAEAQLRFAAALDRRGGTVGIVYFPEGDDGAKAGFDDYRVAGGTVAGLDALTRPWTGHGPGIWLRDTSETDADELRRQRDAARDDNRALIGAIMNPEVSRSELIVAVSAAALAAAKVASGEVEPDGTVRLTAAEIANDWRPAAATGERLAPTNPNGERFRVARSVVTPTLTASVARGLVRATPRKVPRTHRNGSRYTDTEWAFASTASIAAALQPWATYRPPEPKTRKPRTASPPCPHCGEVHPVIRLDACAGCGSVLDEFVINPASSSTPAPAETASDNLSEASTAPLDTPLPRPQLTLSDKLSEAPADPAEASPGPLAALVQDGARDRLRQAFAQMQPLFSGDSDIDIAADPAEVRTASDGRAVDLGALTRDRGKHPAPKPSMLPGMGAPTLDRYTDGAIGGRP